MTPALVILAALFGLLFLARVGAARRRELARRWPVALLAAAAAYALIRGAMWPAVALTLAAGAAWVFMSPRPRPRTAPPPRREDPRDIEARAVLGVGPNASEAEIRRAFRERIVRAHPDRGGAHADAARLTAARDRLLGRRRTGL